MNLIAMMLQDHPDAVDSLVERAADTASFDDIVAVVEERDFPVILNRETAEILKARRPLGSMLEPGGGYLPVIEVERWREFVQDAEVQEDGGEDEWVGFAAGETQARGVSMPTDSSTALRVSMFTRIEEAVCRVSIDYPGVGSTPSGMSVGLPAGCSLPDWGRCGDGECNGDCKLVRRPKVEAFFCMCPHLP